MSAGIVGYYWWRSYRLVARDMRLTYAAVAVLRFPTLSDVQAITGLDGDVYQFTLLYRLEVEGRIARTPQVDERETRWRLPVEDTPA
jgi:hypothetical protein